LKIGKNINIQDIIYENDIESFSKFIKDNDPSENDSIIFSSVCESNRVDMLLLLINDKRVNTINRGCYGLMAAFREQHHEIIKILLTNKVIINELNKKDNPMFPLFKEKLLLSKISSF
jgi:hypothetical protein